VPALLRYSVAALVPCPERALGAGLLEAAPSQGVGALSFLSFAGYDYGMSIAVRAGAAPADPAAFAAAVRDAVAAGESLRVQVGDAVCDINGDLAVGVLALLDAVGAGLSVDITALPADLTTGQAADLLGVSRPTVVALIDKGTLPATRVGTHRRLRTLDVLNYREQARQRRGAALDELVAVSDELGLYDK
jgi:excisionase family DNA binding protein